MPEFSVIVPTFNSQDYILQCINSILEQTNCDYELIVVDDGSRDRTRDILHMLNDPHIKYIEREHAGVSSTRNEGILHTTGEYVIFVDSDDYIDPNTLEIFSNVIGQFETPDIVMGNVSVFTDCAEIPSELFREPFFSVEILNNAGKENTLNWLREEKIFTCFVTRYAFRRSFLLENDLFFIPELLCEDEELSCRALVLAETIKFTGKSHYHHRIRKNSLSWNSWGKSVDRYISLMRIILNLETLWADVKTSDSEKIFLREKCNYYLWILPDENNAEDLIADVKFRAFVLEYGRQLEKAINFLTYEEEVVWFKDMLRQICGPL